MINSERIEFSDSTFCGMMNLRRLCLVSVRVLACSSILFLCAATQAQTLTIQSIGEGPTKSEAKADAIRRALQQAFSQLVLVDRVISGDKIMRDRVMSTSNGYVEKYEELAWAETPMGVRVEAKVLLSASRIENFVGVIASGTGEVNASAIGQEIARRELQGKAAVLQGIARGEIFDRLFEDYPAGVVSASLQSMKLSEPDAKTLLMHFEVTHNPRFIRSLRETLAALSLSKCEKRAGGRSAAFCGGGDRVFFEIIEKSLPQTSLRLSYGEACLSDGVQDKAECYLLDHGAYFWSGYEREKPISRYDRRVGLPDFAIFGRFEDNSGRSAMKDGAKCVRVSPDPPWVRGRHVASALGIGEVQSIGTRYSSAARSSGLRDPLHGRVDLSMALALSIEPRRFKAQMQASEVDLPRAVKFVAVVVALQGRDRQGHERKSLGLTATGDRAVDPCVLLEEASMRAGASADTKRR